MSDHRERQYPISVQHVGFAVRFYWIRMWFCTVYFFSPDIDLCLHTACWVSLIIGSIRQETEYVLDIIKLHLAKLIAGYVALCVDEKHVYWVLIVLLYRQTLSNGWQEEEGYHVYQTCISCWDWIFLCQEEANENNREARVPKVWSSGESSCFIYRSQNEVRLSWICSNPLYESIILACWLQPQCQVLFFVVYEYDNCEMKSWISAFEGMRVCQLQLSSLWHNVTYLIDC